MINYKELEAELLEEVFKYADQLIYFQISHGISLGYIETKLKEALAKCGHNFGD